MIYHLVRFLHPVDDQHIKMKLVIINLAISLAIVSSHHTALHDFETGNLEFTTALYSAISDKKPGENLIFSSFSIEVIMALLREGAKGESAKEITEALSLPNEERTKEAIKQLQPALSTCSNDTKLLSANLIYVGEEFEILKPFEETATDTYQASVKNVDFGKPEQAADTINQDVENLTNNKIKDLIDSKTITNLVRMILVNTMYLNAKWAKPFQKQLTRKEDFHISETETTKVDMMHIEGSFSYHESPCCDAKYLVVPFANKDLSMTFVLFNKIDGLENLKENITECLFAHDKSHFSYEQVQVSLPRFDIETSMDLKPILQGLGLNIIFTDDADLSGISTEDLYVSDVRQKAFINVTESGVEAAAATSVKIARLLAVQPTPVNIFRADHPFCFFITYKDIILFSGKKVK